MPCTGIEFPFNARWQNFDYESAYEYERVYTTETGKSPGLGIPRKGPSGLACLAIENRRIADI